jgi:hypothetical protein
MKKLSLKNSRPYVALALLIQSFTFFIMFIILCVKKKSIAAAFLAVSAMEGAAGTYLLCQMKSEADAEFDPELALANDAGLDIAESALSAEICGSWGEEPVAPRMSVHDIPRDENVSEDEFL